MADTDTNQPSWKKYENHPGPHGDQVYAAWTSHKPQGGENMQGGGMQLKQTPRKMKHRGLRAGNVRIK